MQNQKYRLNNIVVDIKLFDRTPENCLSQIPFTDKGCGSENVSVAELQKNIFHFHRSKKE